MKIAINNCYGGFSVGREVAEKLKEKGFEIGKPFISNFSKDGKKFSKESYYLSNETFNIEDEDYNAYRSHKSLIEAIQSSDNPNGALSNIIIVDIDDDEEWYIDNYDGVESIRRKGDVLG